MSKRVVLAGGSGYLGGHLASALAARGDRVVVLTRGKPHRRAGVEFVHWDGRRLGPWAQELEGADALVHLAGKLVDCRPTRANVDELIRSRVQSVRAVGEATAACASPPAVWVQMCTLAIHGDTGDAVIDETTVPTGIGPRQMVTVALAWENAFRQATIGVPRAVLLRAGIAIGGSDRALKRLTTLVRLGLGGRVGPGNQWVSWIAVPDLIRIVLRAIDDPTMSGLYVAAAPTPITNADMMASLRRLLRRPWGLPAPAPLTHIGAWLIGSDPALALTGRRALPRRLLDEGHTFETTDFATAARQALPGRR